MQRYAHAFYLSSKEDRNGSNLDLNYERRAAMPIATNGISRAKPSQGKRRPDWASPSVISSVLAIGGNLQYAVLNSPGPTKRLTVFAVMLHASQIVKTSVSLRRASRGSFAGRSPSFFFLSDSVCLSLSLWCPHSRPRSILRNIDVCIYKSCRLAPILYKMHNFSRLSFNN